MGVIPIGLVGLGKIACDQHLPALETSADFRLAGAATLDPASAPVPAFPDLATLLAERPEIAAVSLCTPPQGRFELARQALAQGRHLMLEKPPGASVGEARLLAALARRAGVSLFLAWHSRYAAAVEPARRWLEGKRVLGGRIVWKEDVRRWHPGQAWIWRPGGLGVFDPGINALSILTRLLPETLRVQSAAFETPANRAAPIAATLAFRTLDDAPVSAVLDWRQEGPQTWDIEIDTDAGTLRLTDGGGSLIVDGAADVDADPLQGEYPRLYARFAQLIRDGASDADLEPMRLVADAFLLAERRTVEPFED